LIASTHGDYDAQYSPDGKKIAVTSIRSGNREIWISETDGSNPIQLTSFGGPLVGFKDWAPDSQSLVFHARPEGQSDIFVIGAGGGPPARLTMDSANDMLPRFSSDGRSIYFSSDRSGRSEIWKMSADGGEATRITTGGGRSPMESPDGRTLYYAHINPEKGIWKMPVHGGEPVQVTGPIGPQAAFVVGAKGIWYASAPPNRHMIHFHNFSTGKSRPVVVTDRQIGGFSLSPDQRSIIFGTIDRTASDLMVVENFAVR
jgi:Tol biopolymer transport system component